MIRRSSLILLEVALAVAAAMAVALGLLAYRLSAGPLELPEIVRSVERQMTEARDGRPVRIEKAALVWSPQTRALEVKAFNLQVLDKEGRVLSTSRAVTLSFSIPALALGRLSLKAAEFDGAEATMTVRKDGAAELAFGPPGSAPDVLIPPPPPNETLSQRVNRILDGLADAFKPVGPGGRLRSVRVRNLRASLVDERVDGLWTLTDGTLAIGREQKVIRFSLKGGVSEARGPSSPAALAIVADTGFRNAALDISVKKARPADLAPARFAKTARFLDASVSGTVSAALDRRDGVTRLDGAFEVGRGRLNFADGAAPIDGGRFLGRFDIDSDLLVLEDVALAGSKTRVSGEMRLENVTNLLRAARAGAPFELSFPHVALDMPGVFVGPLPLSEVKARGALFGSQKRIVLDSFSARANEAVVRLAGEALLARGKDGKLRPGFTLEGDVLGKPDPQTVMSLWPLQAAKGARDYLMDAMKSGELSDVRFKAHVTPAMLAAGGLPNEALALSFKFANVNFAYVPGMDPIVGGRGRGTLFGNSFDLALDAGTVGAIQVRKGRVYLPRLFPKGALSEFSGRLEGPTRDVVNLLRQAPIGFDEHVPFAPETIVGRGAVDFMIKRPLLSNVPKEDYRFAVDGRFSGVGGRSRDGKISISDWDLTVKGDDAALTLSGPLSFGRSTGAFQWIEKFKNKGPLGGSRLRFDGVVHSADAERLGYPVEWAATGPIGAQLDAEGDGLDVRKASVSLDLAPARGRVLNGYWTKPAGATAKAKLSIERAKNGDILIPNFEARAPGVLATGSVRVLQDGRIAQIDIPTLSVDGRTQAEAHGKLGADGVLAVKVSGPSVDLAGFLGGNGPAEPVPAAPVGRQAAGALQVETTKLSAVTPLLVVVEADALQFKGGAKLTSGRVRMITNGEAITALDMKGADPKGQTVTLSIKPKLASDQGVLSFYAPDAGFAWRAITGADNVRGGVARAEGVWFARKPESAQATVTITNFTLLKMPVMARLFSSVGSMRGMADTLNGEGIAFKSLEAPITYTKDQLVLGESRMSGSSLGFTAKGVVQLDTGEMDLDGVVVPVYGLNSLFNNIPLLGSLLASRKGEGFLGVTYTMRGPLEEAKVFVNPLSALTPGILRRIFEPISLPGRRVEDRPKRAG